MARKSRRPAPAGRPDRAARKSNRVPPGDVAALILAALRVVLPILLILTAVTTGVVLLVTVVFR